MTTQDTSLDIAELVEVALAAAAVGAATLRAGYGQAVQISGKDNAGDLVTEIDVAAERSVRQTLARLRPQDLVTGEELPDSSASQARVRWSIDPLDGTTNFTRRIPYFATSVGAQELATGEWVAGVVHAPMLDKVYVAGRGLGSRMRHAGTTSVLSGPTGSTSARLLGTGFSYSAHTREIQSRELAQLLTSYTDIRAIGSAALAICMVADGSLDAYVESDLGEYDWAGGAVVAQEAGVQVHRPGPQSSVLTVLPG
ncbi:MAG: inositol monophosphatase family protein [Beutenbergiaceae bacterium]